MIKKTTGRNYKFLLYTKICTKKGV